MVNSNNDHGSYLLSPLLSVLSFIVFIAVSLPHCKVGDFVWVSACFDRTVRSGPKVRLHTCQVVRLPCHSFDARHIQMLVISRTASVHKTMWPLFLFLCVVCLLSIACEGVLVLKDKIVLLNLWDAGYGVSFRNCCGNRMVAGSNPTLKNGRTGITGAGSFPWPKCLEQDN